MKLATWILHVSTRYEALMQHFLYAKD